MGGAGSTYGALAAAMVRAANNADIRRQIRRVVGRMKVGSWPECGSAALRGGFAADYRSDEANSWREAGWKLIDRECEGSESEVRRE